MVGFAKGWRRYLVVVASALSTCIVARAEAQEEVEVPPVHEPPEVVAADAPELIQPRVGFSVLGGYTFDEPDGWMLGGSVRLGMSFGGWFSVSYQPTALYAALDRPGSGEDGAFALWNTLLFELTPIEFLSIGFGPSVDVWVDCDRGVATNVEQAAALSGGKVGCAEENASFGLHGRVALNLGGHGPGSGGGVQVSFEAHPTWFGDDFTTVALLGGLGFEIF